MATHSSVLAWRIPGTGEPDGLPSMGSHRVGHDWSNLAASAAAGLLGHHHSRSSPKLMCIESVMPSSHLILCRPFLLLLIIPASIRVFSNEWTLRMRWPNYWSFSFSVIPSKENHDWSPLERTGWISLQSKGLLRAFSNTTLQKHQFFSTREELITSQLFSLPILLLFLLPILDTSANPPMDLKEDMSRK